MVPCINYLLLFPKFSLVNILLVMILYMRLVQKYVSHSEPLFPGFVYACIVVCNWTILWFFLWSSFARNFIKKFDLMNSFYFGSLLFLVVTKVLLKYWKYEVTYTSDVLHVSISL